MELLTNTLENTIFLCGESRYTPEKSLAAQNVVGRGKDGKPVLDISAK